ncbi:hypothetical protein LNTAR_21165 [Lentisphaera araneosa HTCC2155]|uniref:Right handed beta helix domain-containing protein n=2 Tax=Lentisphaera TaxID=256846 RepID=A6DLW7_9BACT|nr:hypothetical protein LNTAR_21165 [Lentisphaera araneosa HTCC2155]
MESLDLKDEITKLLAQGKTELNLPKGRYKISEAIHINNTKSLTINGNGSTLIMPPKGELLFFSNIQNIHIKNLTVDCDPLPFTQGTITKISDDHLEYEYEVHPGYPSLDAFPKYKTIGRSGIFVFDPKTLRWKDNVPDLYTKDSTSISLRKGQFTFKHLMEGYRNIKVGDYVAFKNMYGNVFLFKGCGDVTMEDVIVNTGPGAGFLMRTCTGKVIMKRCKIEKGPKPKGAVHERLLSTIADGFNLAYSRQGVTMEECEFSYMGDDAVNLHGSFMSVVKKIDDSTFLIGRAWSDEPLQKVLPGDKIRILDGNDFGLINEAKILNLMKIIPPQELDQNLRKKWRLPTKAKIFYSQVKLDKKVNAEAGNKVEVPAIACPNFVFRRNYFHDHRARGLRLGASHGLIEQNRFERIKSTPISLGPHAIHNEGGWIEDIVVKNNTIMDSCFDERTFDKNAANTGAIVLLHFLHDKSAKYVQENRNIRILNNKIERVGGPGLLITSADNVTVEGNTFSNTHLLNCDKSGNDIRLKATGVISINYSDKVDIKNNYFGKLGSFARKEFIKNPE